MKKFAVLITGTFLLVGSAFAGGILTNTNQSAQFARMLSRNASTDLDAVYFNPAGLTQMKNGFYFGLHNQSITQTKTISSEYPLKYNEYIGDVKAPVFPTAFAVYKMDNWAFSAGFGPNGGGGSAEYKKGLPSFERRIANQVNNQLVPSLAGLSALGYNVQPGYDVNIQFEGQSVFWGIQLGVTAKINDVISGYAGVRYLPSVNTYKGTIENISLKVNGEMQNAQAFLTTASTTALTKAGLASDAAKNFNNAATLAGSLAANDPVTNPTLQATLTAIGQDPSKLNNAAAKAILTSASNTYTSQASLLTVTSLSLAGTATMVEDIEVDTKQSGAGFTPIIGINITPIEGLNIGVKYEHKTSLKLTNDTKKSDAGMDFLKDGATIPSDIPAIIAGGADYQVLDKLKVSGSFNVYLDKNVNWGKNIYMQDRTIDKNYLELAFGLEYKLTDNFALSTGFLSSDMGVSKQYQSDFSYGNDSYTGALGFQWNLSKKLVLDAGMMLTTYKDETKLFTDFTPNFKETYAKDTFAFAFGIGYKIF